MKMGIGRMEVRFSEEGREWRLPTLLYSNDLVLCGESKKDKRDEDRTFYRGIQMKGSESKKYTRMVMVFGEEERSVCEVLWMGGKWSVLRILNTWEQNCVRNWQKGGKLQV